MYDVEIFNLGGASPILRFASNIVSMYEGYIEI